MRPEAFGAKNIWWWAYNLAVTCAWPMLAYYYVLRVRLGQKYQSSYRQRLGWGSPSWAPGAPTVWFHALSVGETHSVVPLVKSLKECYPHINVVFSSATETGQQAARRQLSPWVARFFFLPHDFPWAVTELVRQLRPLLFILVETDIWPNLLWALTRRGIPSILVNARLSPRSFQHLRRIRALFGPVLRCFDQIFVQSTQDLRRFQQLGFTEERLHAIGNLKFDQAFEPLSVSDLEQLRVSAGIASDRPVWIAGSTHPGEEQLLLQVHHALLPRHPELLLILAPRQVQRGAALAALAQGWSLQASRRSRQETAAGKPVLVLDTMGELARFYGLAHCAFLGGSLLPIGGHNPLEPLAQGKPVLWGPFMFNFRELEQTLLDAGCARKVRGPQELRDALTQCLTAPGQRQRTAEAARQLFLRHQGSSQRVLQHLGQFFR
jgi:3-deoxy-D-manno-octulosonic-acid transferase